MIVLSYFLSAVGSPLVFYQIPCYLSSWNKTRLQCRPGHIATSCSSSKVSSEWPSRTRSRDLYPFTHIFVLPTHIKSPSVGGVKFQIRFGSFVIWHVEPESRMNKCLSEYSLNAALNEAEMNAVLIVAISWPSSQSSSSISVGVCGFLIAGVRDQFLLWPLSIPCNSVSCLRSSLTS